HPLRRLHPAPLAAPSLSPRAFHCPLPVDAISILVCLPGPLRELPGARGLNAKRLAFGERTVDLFESPLDFSIAFEDLVDPRVRTFRRVNRFSKGASFDRLPGIVQVLHRTLEIDVHVRRGHELLAVRADHGADPAELA